MKKRRNPWIIVGIVAIVILVGGIYLYQSRQTGNSDAVLRSAQVSRGDLETTVSASGNVEAQKTAELRFDTPGKIQAVAVEVGDRVKAGDELARLDTDDLERAVAQAKISLEQAQIKYDQLTKEATEEDLRIARANVYQASQSLQAAESNKKAIETQVAENVRKATETRDNARNKHSDYQTQYGLGQPIPKQWVDDAYKRLTETQTQLDIAAYDAQTRNEQAQSQWLQANSAYLQARESLRRLEEGAKPEEIRQAELQVEQARLNLEQAQARLDAAILKAPFDGIVGAINLETGVQAPTTLPAVILVDDSAFYVNVTIDETDIGKLEIAQEVIVTLDAYPETPLAGKVDTIAPAATNSGGVIAYPVRVRLSPSSEASVRDGMTASILVGVGRTEAVLLVPNWAVRTDQATGETYSYRLVNDAPERVPVTAGSRNESYTAILSGLNEGDTVVLINEQRNLLQMGEGGARPGAARP